MTQGDQKGCQKESIRTQEGQIAAARTKQREGDGYTGMRKQRERQGKNARIREEGGN